MQRATTYRISPAAIATAALMAFSTTVQASLIFQVRTGGGASSATVVAGETVALQAELVTDDSADHVGAVVCDLNVPSGWMLVGRAYGPHGWFEADGTWDNSTPYAAALPVETTSDLYAPTAETDVHFETVRSDFQDLSGPGTYVLEEFVLGVPTAAEYGAYTLSFSRMEASDISGMLDLVEGSDSFVLTIVPEPSACVLLAAACLMAGLRRHRRRRRPPGTR